MKRLASSGSNNGLSLSFSGGLPSSPGNSSLSLSRSSGPKEKKPKYTGYFGIAEDFCGFSDEVSVHMNALKMMNTELFCKGKQLAEQISTLQTKIRCCQDDEQRLKEKLRLIQSRGATALTELSFAVQNPNVLTSASPSSNQLLNPAQLAQLVSQIINDLKLLTDQQRAFVENERAQTRQIAERNVAMKHSACCQQVDGAFTAHRTCVTQILEQKRHIVLLEEDSLAINQLKKEIADLKGRIESEKRKQLPFKVKEEEEEEQVDAMNTEEQPLTTKVEEEVSFEALKRTHDITLYTNVSQKKDETIRGLNERLKELQSKAQSSHDLGSGSSQQYSLNEDALRASPLVRVVSMRKEHSDNEGWQLSKEAEDLSSSMRDFDAQIHFDIEQHNKLSQMHARASSEKLTHQEQRILQLAKEVELLQKKHQERVAELEQSGLAVLSTRLNDLDAQLKREKKRREELEETRNEVSQSLWRLESVPPPSVSMQLSLEQQVNANMLRQEHIKLKKLEIEQIQKDEAKSVEEGKEILGMMKRQMPKCTPQLIKKAELVSTEMVLKNQIHHLSESYGAKKKALDSNENVPNISIATAASSTTSESVAELKEALEDTLAVNADLKEEIGAIEGEFYRDLNENIVQTKSVIDYEENNLQRQAQKAKQNQIHTLLKRKLDMLNDNVTKLESKIQALDELTAKYAKKVKLLESKIDKATKESDCVGTMSDPNDMLRTNGSNLVAELNQRMSELQGEIDNYKGLSDSSVMLEKEKGAQQKLQDENYLLNQQIDFNAKQNVLLGGQADGEVLTYYKKLINCPTCDEGRPKNYIITKCFHLFCEDCALSYDACPTCGRSYCEKDLRQVYI